ncbi:MAG: transmembrane anchor protein [Granulosicoccus sp.]
MNVNSHERVSNASSQVEGVEASPGGLLKATIVAAVAAGAILTFVWLPAEYGIDPTGAGHMLGLTEMGTIKEQLHVQADADAAAQALNNAEPGPANARIMQKLDDIQEQLTALTTTIEATPTIQKLPTVEQPAAQPIPDTQTSTPAELVAPWRDEMSYTLVPGQGIEIKLVMEEGAVAEFEWTANGAVVNHDTHGDGDGQSISYEKGRGVPEQTGQLKAAFTGNHGWFWRNRTDANVELTLRTRGDYEELAFP